MSDGPVRIKICGITRLEDALEAARAGADAVGFVFHRESPRYISPLNAGRIARALPPFLTTVGVFVDVPREEVSDTLHVAGLDVVQLHGGESPDYCLYFPRVIKALRVRDRADIQGLSEYSCVSAFLLDAYSEDAHGGTGKSIDREIAKEVASAHRIVLAGGLAPDNVADAVRQVRPYGVDVSSGVESAPGLKDHEKISLFIKNARSGATGHTG
jgi:phosphoribosylanthranilate isomerase